MIHSGTVGFRVGGQRSCLHDMDDKMIFITITVPARESSSVGGRRTQRVCAPSVPVYALARLLLGNRGSGYPASSASDAHDHEMSQSVSTLRVACCLRPFCWLPLRGPSSCSQAKTRRRGSCPPAELGGASGSPSRLPARSPCCQTALDRRTSAWGMPTKQ